MAVYKYIGQPSYGLSTKDLKVPSDSGWKYHNDITPNVTEITVSGSDVKEAEYFQNNPKTFELVSE